MTCSLQTHYISVSPNDLAVFLVDQADAPSVIPRAGAMPASWLCARPPCLGPPVRRRPKQSLLAGYVVGFCS